MILLVGLNSFVLVIGLEFHVVFDLVEILIIMLLSLHDNLILIKITLELLTG